VRCGKPANVSSVLIGLHQVGIIGLRDALKKADESDLDQAEEITEYIIGLLAEDNYVPESQAAAYRRTIWREFLRYRGEGFHLFYSEVDAAVRGGAGEERDRFVQILTSVFGDFELKPVIEYIDSSERNSMPELLIGKDIVVRGCLPRDEFKAAVRRRISDW